MHAATLVSLLFSVAGLFGSPAPQIDLRAAYDVQTYRLDLKVDPAAQTLSGTVGVEATVTAATMAVFELDLMAGRTVSAVYALPQSLASSTALLGKALKFDREGDRIRVHLAKPLRKGETARVAVVYAFKPGATAGRSGLRFGKTPDGKPWVSTSCQVLGAHSWWPCKEENSHPEDKFAHLLMNVTVPEGLTAVCNGKLTSVDSMAAGWKTFRWKHDYPCENYSVTLNVAPYVLASGTLNVPGNPPIPFSYYMLPADIEKAKFQFKDAPGMIAAFTEAFGPFPYPNSKFGLVQTDFWGMEHSTAVAYGNSFPSWLKANGGGKDQWEFRNKYFDYILIHECAHEWWGNAVSAKDWGHLWIHEGFGTYAEGVYVEKTQGRAKADEYFEKHLRPQCDPDFQLFRGAGVPPSRAFSNNVYFKGAMVLNTLRAYVNDDALWWKALRTFNMRFRYKNAVTDDFAAVLQEVAPAGPFQGYTWKQFFKEWFYGPGHPSLSGTIRASGKQIVVDVQNSGSKAASFHVPLDLSWKEGPNRKSRRVVLAPGANQIKIECSGQVTELAERQLHRILCDNGVVVAGE